MFFMIFPPVLLDAVWLAATFVCPVAHFVPFCFFRVINDVVVQIPSASFCSAPHFFLMDSPEGPAPTGQEVWKGEENEMLPDVFLGLTTT
jgi:hypothetical protein